MFDITQILLANVKKVYYIQSYSLVQKNSQPVVNYVTV